MARPGQEHILLIGDAQRQVHSALATALPAAHVTPVASVFDGIAELVTNRYTAVLAAAEPIERRPEAAVKTLRSLAGSARLILFGHPALELLSRKMLQFGCDDYIVTPAASAELQQMFGTPFLRIASALPPASRQASAAQASPNGGPLPPGLHGMPVADILLDAVLEHPGAALAAALAQINQLLGPAMQLHLTTAGSAPPVAADGQVGITHPVRDNSEDVGHATLVLPREQDSAATRHFLARIAQQLGKVHCLEERHTRLQKLAITDELTGLYNARYFRHFLMRIIEKARSLRFPVTLLLFDIDNFKRYNDDYGHGVGDDILRQTSALLRRCCREHDLVARIGGDEFAVVFWEKEGPRQPREPRPATAPPAASRPPQTPLQIFERFKKLIATQTFKGLGTSGKGALTISAGLAVYPFDARDMNELIEAADHALMFGAKRSGKNSIFLVGSGLPPA